MRRVLALLVVPLAVATAACSSSTAEPERDDAASTTSSTAPPPPCPAGASSVAAGEQKVTLPFGGTERWYLRHVPPAHDGERRVPVVVDLHGYLEGAEIHAVHSRLGPYGDAEGFVTITPQGSGTDVVRWDLAPGSDDVRFIGALLDEVERTLCVDRDRVYVTGMSYGALMTSRLACEYADRIAAVAPVAGVTDPTPCGAARPVPVVAFHGTEDRYLPFDGGVGTAARDLPVGGGSDQRIGDVVGGVDGGDAAARRALPAVPDSLAAWAARNGCDDAAPAEEAVADDVVHVTYDCPAGAEVELYRVDGGGHTWPGSAFSQSIERIVGRTTTSISANEVMWSFFRSHPRSPASG